MIRNQAGQFVEFLCFDASGFRDDQAGNITCTLSIDDGAPSAIDLSAIESLGMGNYRAPLPQASTNGHKLRFVAACSTSGVQVVALPSNVIFTKSSAASGGLIPDITQIGESGVVEYDIPVHYRGDTWGGIAQAFLLDSDEEPVDITGASLRMYVKRAKSDATPRLAFTSDGGEITIVDGPNGEYAVGAAIIDLPGRSYFYDVEVVLADGTVKTSMQGRWPIVNDVTR